MSYGQMTQALENSGLSATTQQMNRGHFYAFSAYTLWGLLPIYWQRLHVVPAGQVVAHRIVWSCLVLIPIILWGGQWTAIRQALGDRRVLARQILAAVLVCANWLGFIWAVGHDRILESSLGYFINPLMSIVVAVALLGERLRRVQWAAVGVAAVGVLWLSVQYGAVPWVAISLATTFCLYSLVKKTTQLHPVASLSIETWALFIPAIGFLIYEHAQGRGGWLAGDATADTLLIASGVATTIPLLLFAAGAQLIPLSTTGLLQYVGPTLQFLLGTLVYHESFSAAKLIGFALVWLALFIYASDMLRNLSRPRTAPAPRP